MARIQDPGNAKSREQAKAERLKAWKKPAKKADQDALRAERIKDWEGRNGTRLPR